MSTLSPAMLAYLMSDDPEQVQAAAEAVNADRAAGKRVFERSTTPAEQRRAGMLPPSQRPEHRPVAPAAPVPMAQASEIVRAREAADRAEQRWDEAFAEHQRAQEALDELETQGYADAWSSDDEVIEPVPDEEIALAEYEARTENPLSQAAVDAMSDAQRDLFIKAGAQTVGGRGGKEWKGGSGAWQAGEQVER